MKQSLIKAMNEAKEMSLQHLDKTYYVFDKKGGRPIIHSQILVNSSLICSEMFRRGYYPTVKYNNGIESRA